MKNLVFCIVLLFCVQGYTQRKPKIKGNRTVVEVRENLPPFNAIILKDDLEVVLRKSFEEGYTLQADENLVDVLKFEVTDYTLVISSYYKITSKKKLDIVINYKELESVTQYNGKLSTADIVSADVLRIATSGPARLELSADAILTQLAMEDISSADLTLTTDSLEVDLRDRIDARIYTTSESIAVSMKKNATARMEGVSGDLQVELVESAKLKAEKLESSVVRVTIQESADAQVYAMDRLELSSKGSSKTDLYGNPKIEILEFLDTSKLHKQKD
ncbi:MAG: DUF2807 domain-containing protein [Bacteroidota bacterium]